MSPRPQKLRRLSRAAFNMASLATGAALAYTVTLDMPHKGLATARHEIDKVIGEIHDLEPGLTIDPATLAFRFDPGLDPAFYGATAVDRCGFSGTISSFGAIIGIGFIDHGYGRCAEGLLSRQGYESGTRLDAAEIFRQRQAPSEIEVAR